MSNQELQPNYRAFIPIGITFAGAGVVFLTGINAIVGAGLILVGSTFLLVGAMKTLNKNKGR